MTENSSIQKYEENEELVKIENKLLEEYLLQKNIELTSDYSITPKQDCSVPVNTKLQITAERLSGLNTTLETRTEATDKLESHLKVMLHEVNERIQDIQRDAHAFQKEVVEGGMCATNPNEYKAEKYIQYCERKLLAQEATLDRLRLKNSTLMQRKNKVECQLNRDESNDSSFQYIDYQQMQIKRKQTMKELETKASKLSLEKISYEKAKRRIDKLQSQLRDIKSKVEKNKQAIVMREAYLERLDDQVYAKEDEVDGLKNVLNNKKAPDQILEDEVVGPDINEYIMQKKEIYELRESIKAMERKVEIATIQKKQSDKQRVVPSRQSPECHQPALTRWRPGML